MMAIDVPSSSQDEALQDRFNRQLVEELDRLTLENEELLARTVLLETSMANIKAIPDDGSITTVEGIITYLRGV